MRPGNGGARSVRTEKDGIAICSASSIETGLPLYWRGVCAGYGSCLSFCSSESNGAGTTVYFGARHDLFWVLLLYWFYVGGGQSQGTNRGVKAYLPRETLAAIGMMRDGGDGGAVVVASVMETVVPAAAAAAAQVEAVALRRRSGSS